MKELNDHLVYLLYKAKEEEYLPYIEFASVSSKTLSKGAEAFTLNKPSHVKKLATTSDNRVTNYVDRISFTQELCTIPGVTQVFRLLLNRLAQYEYSDENTGVLIDMFVSEVHTLEDKAGYEVRICADFLQKDSLK